MATKKKSKHRRIIELPSECGAAGKGVNNEVVNNEDLLELAQLYHKNGQATEAQSSIDTIIARLDREFESFRCNPREKVKEDLQDAATLYKQCCLFFLDKLQLQDKYGLTLLTCLYKGLILHGTFTLYDDDERVKEEIWKKVLTDFKRNSEGFLETTSDLVRICSHLCTVRPRIVLAVAFDIMGMLLQLVTACTHQKIVKKLHEQICPLLLTCGRCHFTLEEYDKAIEAFGKLWPEPLNCRHVDTLLMWGWSLYHTKQYPTAITVAEHCMKLDITPHQGSSVESLLRQSQEKCVQADRTPGSQESQKKHTTVSYYIYGKELDLVGNIDLENNTFTNDSWETESIATSEHSTLSASSVSSSVSTSSRSTRSGRRKIRRKTKDVWRKKGIYRYNTEATPPSSLPLKSLGGYHADKSERIRQWMDNTSNRRHNRRGRHNSSGGEELIYSRSDVEFDDNVSDVSSVRSFATSRTRTSRANFSPDEFSGSEYDLSDTDDDWYSSDADDPVQSDDEEIEHEEPSYFLKSLQYHSGNFKPRNFLESECFQEGLQLDKAHVDELGEHYFKSKKLVYNDIFNNKNLENLCKNDHTKHIYKKCSISIQAAHLAICKPLEPNDEIQEIEIAGRSKCGMTYTDDTVIVQLFTNHGNRSNGKVHGEVKSLVERHRYKDIDHPVFVCLIDLKEGHLMKPLCRTVPKLHILHSKVRRNHKHLKKSRVEVYKYDDTTGTLKFSRYHDVQQEERENLLFVVAFIKWKRNKIYPLAAVIDVIHSSQNPYDGIRIISKEHHVPFLYSKTTVDGVTTVLEAAKSFNATGYKDRTGLRVFTIDPPGSKDLDDALSITKEKDGSYVVGVHIADVSSLVTKDDPVDLEARSRSTTFYPGRGFRPYAMLPECLSCEVLSLLPGKKKPVISVFFKFDRKGRLVREDPVIEKSIIKSSKQFTYQEVQNIFDKRMSNDKKLESDIQMLFKLSKELKRKRLGDGSFALPVEIDINEEENPMETYEAHSLVEEFMVLTNGRIANMLRKKYPACVPLVCQPHPVYEVFKEWYELNKHYLYHVIGLQSIVTPEGKILVNNSPPEGRRRRLIPLQKWVLDEIVQLATDSNENENLKKIKKLICSDYFHPKQALAYNEWILFQESSRYVCSSEGLDDKQKLLHFSLRTNSYVHFTSPIRRYCDVIIHRLVTAMIQSQPSPYQPEEISELCGKMNDASKRANQFKKDCKQFLLGLYLRKHPILFNGFVKEMSDSGIKVLIPGLQKLSSTRKEIKFNTLDVGSKPQIREDIDMVDMTQKEKERNMVVVKWEKRLYSYSHRYCQKPKPSKFDRDRQNFSPHLRIYPHQHTAFLRYKDHWKKIVLLALAGQDHKLKLFLKEFKDYDERKKRKIEDKAEETAESNDRSNAGSTDPSSQVVGTGNETLENDHSLHVVGTGNETRENDHSLHVVGTGNETLENDHSLHVVSTGNETRENDERGVNKEDDCNQTNKPDTVTCIYDRKANSDVGETESEGISTYKDSHAKKSYADIVNRPPLEKGGENSNNTDDIPLLDPLPPFSDGLLYNQIQVNYWIDKNTIGSFNRSVPDVSSEVKQGIIVEHRCKFQVPYLHGQVVQVQLSADINRGFLTPKPQVLNITDNVKFCIDHFDSPVKTLLRYAKFPSKDSYKSVEEYVKIWIPIIEMESAVSAVHGEDTAVINDIAIDFKGRKGRFKLTKGYCDIRDLDLHMPVVEPDKKSQVVEMRENVGGNSGEPSRQGPVQQEGAVVNDVDIDVHPQQESRQMSNADDERLVRQESSLINDTNSNEPPHQECVLINDTGIEKPALHEGALINDEDSKEPPQQESKLTSADLEGLIQQDEDSEEPPQQESKLTSADHEGLIHRDGSLINDTDSVYSLCEELPNDTLQADTLSVPEKEQNKACSEHSSNKPKPEYTKVLSSHFLCIKLMQPLPDPVKAKVGNCLPKNSQYVWIAHGSLIKTRRIRTKKFSKRRGVDKKVLELDLVFQLHEDSPAPPVDKVTSEDKCSLELIMKSKVFRRIEAFIKLLPQAGDLAKHIALRIPINNTDQEHASLCDRVGYDINVPTFPRNNHQQHRAIQKALRSKFSLIQGPPGTGKTFTGVKLIYLFTKMNKMLEEKDGDKRKLIFCGPSNKSVDLVARWVVNKLKDKAPRIIRMYASAYEYKDFPVPGRVSVSSRSLRDSKTDADLKEKGFVLHHIIRQDGKPHARELQEYDAKFMADNEIIRENEEVPHEERRPVNTKLEDIYGYKKLLNNATVEELENYDVIFCTTSMAANPKVLQVTKDCVAQVIIDECGMCTEPESMVPIIATNARQIVLIGDHKQLRPIISCHEAAELGLEKSLFERYSTDRQLMTMLEEQYRMHPSICDFPSRQFYEGKLKTAPGIGMSHQPLKMWNTRNNKGEHIPHVFCHVVGEEETLTVKTKEGNEQSRSNLKEVEQVMKVFKHMTDVEGVDPADINIMSQYNSQCTELRNKLTELGKDRFNVTTVVSSQGGEWDYVIFSLVRSLPKYLIEKNPTVGWCIQNLGFITDRHQINVALTRARKGLVIIGNSELLECDEVWKKLLDNYKEKKCFFMGRNFPPRTRNN